MKPRIANPKAAATCAHRLAQIGWKPHYVRLDPRTHFSEVGTGQLPVLPDDDEVIGETFHAGADEGEKVKGYTERARAVLKDRDQAAA